MDIRFLLRGLVIGFSIAAPVGPIGVLCIRRTLAGGRVSGLVSGLGAATADAIYGCIAGFGLMFISSILVSHQGWLRLIGVGSWYDNAPMESFVGTLKSEWGHHRLYRTHDEARPDLFFYIEAFYNRRRRHSSLDYLSPEAYEQLYHQQQSVA